MLVWYGGAGAGGPDAHAASAEPREAALGRTQRRPIDRPALRPPTHAGGGRTAKTSSPLPYGAATRSFADSNNPRHPFHVAVEMGDRPQIGPVVERESIPAAEVHIVGRRRWWRNRAARWHDRYQHVRPPRHSRTFAAWGERARAPGSASTTCGREPIAIAAPGAFARAASPGGTRDSRREARALCSPCWRIRQFGRRPASIKRRRSDQHGGRCNEWVAR